MASSARKQRRAQAAATKDSYQNLQARLGIGAGSIADGSTYTLNPITRERQKLEAMYRGSWIVGVAVDAVADDMTREGVNLDSVLEPDQMEKISSAMERMSIWQNLSNAIRWSRLYGGAGCLMMIDGQDIEQPLRLDTVGPKSFKGLYVLDRWMAIPSIGEIVQDLGPDLGNPIFYQVQTDAPALVGKKIHHSRFLRFDGVELPYWQRRAEQGWGMSVVERLYDRLTAFDSTSMGAAQLVYKAHLRTLKVKGLTQILATNGPGMEALAKNVEAIRRFQSTEGLSVIDAEDDFTTATYAFSGLSELIMQFGQQLSGSLQIPLVRLFGQSPAGLNSTGESDLRNYYDGILSHQESKLRSPVTRLLSVMIRSELSIDPPEGFNFGFTPLWQVTDKEKADIATSIAGAVVGALDAGVIDKPTAMKELRQSADITGIFSNITDALITEAELEPPPISETLPLEQPAGGKDQPDVQASDT